MVLPGPAGIAREARAGRTKARKIAREVARRARNPLSDGEKTTLWVVGGLGVAGLGYLLWQGMQHPAAAATPPSPPVPPGTTPATPPPVTPVTPTSGVSWPASAVPWAPPAAPANLPVAFGVTDDLTSQDPMWTAMAQSALNIITRASSGGPVSVSYSTPPNGVVDTSYQIALTQIQAALATANAQIRSTNPSITLSNAHQNGILDLKSLAFVMSIAASVAVSSTGTLSPSPTAIMDPILQQQIVYGLGNIASSTATLYAALKTGIVTPINITSALPVFQANYNGGGQQLQLPVSGTLDWMSWAVVTTFAG